MDPVLIQILGAVAYAISSLAFFIRSRETMLRVQSFALFIIVIHFLLLSAWTGAGIAFVNAIKIFMFSYQKEGNWTSKQYWLYIFLLIFLVFGLLTWEGPHSLLPVVAMVFHTLAYWQKDQLKLKIIFMPQSIMWFIYNAIVGSYAGMIAEAAIFLFALISLVKNELRDTRS